VLSKERLLHPATIIAVVALLVALSGAGYAATKIGPAQLKNNAVTTPKIKNNAVSAAKIRANAVNSARLAPGAVRAADLAAGSVRAAALGQGSVSAAKLAAGAVTGPALGDGSVTTAKLGPNAVTGAKIAGATITAANIVPGQVVTGGGEMVRGALTLATSAPLTALLTLPGVATVEAGCSAANVPSISITNTSGTELTQAVTVVSAPATVSTARQFVASGGITAIPNSSGAGIESFTLQWSTGTGAAAKVASATVNISPGATTGCVASGQGVVS
jgi:hypothetical protein